ncbi:MAG: DUF3656 domain-containing protein, partial [Paraprevotella sp.]|nr:DUF3656 domain-containing protein [Paraprevotella sp.]
NFDKELDDILSCPAGVRKIAVEWTVDEYAEGFALTLRDEDEVSVAISFPYVKEMARSSQKENVRTQLSKLGNTPFESGEVNQHWSAEWFIPSSVWAEWRRIAVDKLRSARRMNYPYRYRRVPCPSVRSGEEEKKETMAAPFASQTLTYLANVMNRKAEAFYLKSGAARVEPAFERKEPDDAVLMFCRHCLRYSLGWCLREGKEKSPFHEPFYLVLSDGRRFRLAFDCTHCQMKVYADEKEA